MIKRKMKRVVKIQLLSRSSVAVSTSQDFDDNATITAFWEEETIQKHSFILQQSSAVQRTVGGNQVREILTFSKPMAQSLSILRVYSGLETGAPA